MKADQTDSSTRGPSASGKIEEISSGGAPVDIVLSDPFGELAGVHADLRRTASLVQVQQEALDGLSETFGVEPWMKKVIDHHYNVLGVVHERLEASLSRFDVAESDLYRRGFPRMVRAS
jgi:hypothetical protein